MTAQQQIELPEESFDREFSVGSAKKAMTGVSSRDLWQLDPRRIRFMPGLNLRLNPEKRQAHIRKLADSIKANGFYQDKPISVIVVQEGGELIHYATDGHCRTEATLLAISEGAPIETVPVVTEDRSTTMEDLTVKLYQANSGESLSTYETAIVCKRLQRAGWETSKIAETMGLKTEWVSNLPLLAGTTRYIRDMLIADRVSATEAIKVVKQHGDKAEAVIRKMIERAEADGKERATGKHRTVDLFKKAVTKRSTDLYQAASSVRQDPGYTSLSEDTRKALDDLLDSLELQKDDEL